MRHLVLDRRTMLRGIFGLGVALPTLEIMLDDNGEALASGGALPKRFMFGFAGCALGCDGDEVHNLFVPDIVGPGYELHEGTASLANHGNIRDKVSIISGLRIPYDTGGGIPAGGWWQEFHIEALGPLLSGVRGQHQQDYGVNGPTADQVVADAIGAGTAFPSLQYQVQAAWYLTESAPYGRDRISYRRDGSGNLISVPGQISPKAAYDSLFLSFIPPDDTEALNKARELLKRKSVIDLVRGDFETLAPKLGTVDRIRMERHLDEIRELERQLELQSPDITETCYQYPDPGQDPAVGGAQQTTSDYYGGFDVNLGWSDEDTRARRFSDLIAMAFTCDLTRSVALLYTMAQSHMNVYNYTGFGYDQHELGHSYLGTDVFSAVASWHLDHFGYLAAKLRDTPEGAGSVLDNCAMVLLFEAGHGYDPATGDEYRTHSTENMAVCTAGGASGMRQGEHIIATGMHPVHVINTAMRAVGVTTDLGEVVGTVPGLL